MIPTNVQQFDVPESEIPTIGNDERYTIDREKSVIDTERGILTLVFHNKSFLYDGKDKDTGNYKACVLIDREMTFTVPLWDGLADNCQTARTKVKVSDFPEKPDPNLGPLDLSDRMGKVGKTSGRGGAEKRWSDALCEELAKGLREFATKAGQPNAERFTPSYVREHESEYKEAGYFKGKTKDAPAGPYAGIMRDARARAKAREPQASVSDTETLTNL